MSDSNLPRVDILPHWATVHEHLLHIVDIIPEDKLNWTPKAELWNSRGILIHVADARDGWMGGESHGVVDGGGHPNIWLTARTKADIRREMERTFERVMRFMRDPQKLDGSYIARWEDQQETNSGHYIAFHLLEHDIHHRAELLQRLAMMGIDHGIDI
jgi:uncharacterized damage-inducible protein DinB